MQISDSVIGGSGVGDVDGGVTRVRARLSRPEQRCDATAGRGVSG
jgi:hypothetical protein